MSQFLEQVKLIQDILLEYRTEGAYIFGSRLMGTHNEFSDLDVVVYIHNAVKATKRNDSIVRNLYSIRMTPEGYVRLQMNPCINEIKDKAKLDVNIIGEYTQDTLDSDTYSKKVTIIENYKPVDMTVIMDKIQEARNKSIPFKRNDKDKENTVVGNLYYIGELCRYYNLINTFEKFINPETNALCAMRNEMLEKVCLFAQILDKVDEHNLTMFAINYAQIKIISDIIKMKKVQTGNYNTLALPWINCPNSLFSLEELRLFWNFIENHIKIGVTIMQSTVHSQYSHVIRQYQLSIEDKSGFISAYEHEYETHTNPNCFSKEQKYSKDFFMAVKGEKKKISLTNDMKKIFNKEVPFPEPFGAGYLYNRRRSSGAIYEKILIDNMLSNGFIDVTCFEIEANTHKSEKIYEREHRIWYLKEYHKEFVPSIEALADFIDMLKSIGLEVVLRDDSDERMIGSARVYVPEWKMIINPDTQNVENFINTLCIDDVFACIVSKEYINSSKIILYIVQAKEPFVVAYNQYCEQENMRIMEAQSLMNDYFENLFNKK